MRPSLDSNRPMVSRISVAVHDHIDGTVFQQEFAALKALGQFLANGLFNNIGAGKTCARIGLGDINIAQQSQRR